MATDVARELFRLIAAQPITMHVPPRSPRWARDSAAPTLRRHFSQTAARGRPFRLNRRNAAIRLSA
jgi:hypothetical protein